MRNKDKKNNRSLFSAIVIILVIFTVSFVVKFGQWLAPKLHHEMSDEQVNELLERNFTDWLKNTTGETVTSFNIIGKEYSEEIGAETEPLYNYYNDIIEMCTSLDMLSLEPKERQQFELERTIEFVDTFGDAKRTYTDSLHLEIMTKKIEVLTDMLNGRKTDLDDLRRGAIVNRDYVKKVSGWYVLAKITLNDTLSGRISYAIDKKSRLVPIVFKTEQINEN